MAAMVALEAARPANAAGATPSQPVQTRHGGEAEEQCGFYRPGQPQWPVVSHGRGHREKRATSPPRLGMIRAHPARVSRRRLGMGTGIDVDRCVPERGHVLGERLLYAIDDGVRFGHGEPAIDGDVQIGMDFVSQPAGPGPMHTFTPATCTGVLDFGQDAGSRHRGAARRPPWQHL